MKLKTLLKIVDFTTNVNINFDGVNYRTGEHEFTTCDKDDVGLNQYMDFSISYIYG